MKRTVRYKCTNPECSYWTFSEYNNLSEVAQGARHRDNYKCVRHSSPDAVLSKDNMIRVTEMENGTHPNANGLYWKGGSGFEYGPGFKAFANDFPEGTKLRITAEIILPNEPQTVAGRVGNGCECYSDEDGKKHFCPECVHDSASL